MVFKSKDWSGKRCGKFLFVRQTNKKLRGSILWEVLCDCGNTKFVIASEIFRGKARSCGCSHTDRNHIAGKKYGKLTLIEPTTERNGKGLVIWLVECECGKRIHRESTDVVNGHTISCGCAKRAAAIENLQSRKTPRRKYDPIISSARSVWSGSGYRKECDFETFYRLSQENCYYCGIEPHRTNNISNRPTNDYSKDGYQQTHGNFTYNGLDRIDSSRGHTPDNIVPCCYDCNKAKSALTVNQFLALIERIYLHSIK